MTDRARRVVVLAQVEAKTLNHHQIGTEDILLGLLGEGEGVAAKALQALGISLETVRQEVVKASPPNDGPFPAHLPFTDRAKRVLELSLREALQLGHNYIGTEHVLLGLIREGEGVAAQVLTSLGADLSRVRQQVIQLLSGYASQPSNVKKDDPLKEFDVMWQTLVHIENWVTNNFSTARKVVDRSDRDRLERKARDASALLEHFANVLRLERADRSVEHGMEPFDEEALDEAVADIKEEDGGN